MKVALIYPPYKKENQHPLLPQNRQFRYSNSSEVRIFPLVMGTAVTILKNANHEVLFLDSINERLDEEQFEKRLKDFNPDLVLLETKAPIIKLTWGYIKKLKNNSSIKVALCGDHVSFDPKESLENSDVDFILVGGDYDKGILELANALEQKKAIPKGIWYKKDGKIIENHSIPFVENLDELPFIDRELTQWKSYGEAYLKKPSMYILSGRGCGGGKEGPGCCTFCIWQHAFWKCKARLRTPKNFVDELNYLYKTYHIKEVFDDNEAGGVYDQEWLKEVYEEMKKQNLLDKFYISSNARADSLSKENCKLMKLIGYRLLKVGLESGNNETLKLLCKGETIEEIEAGIKTAKDYGLTILITTMVGFPWEKEKEVKKTYEVTKKLMLYKTKIGDSLQSSVIMPYPHTPLYKLAEAKGWLVYNSKDYEKLDQTTPILKTDIDTQKWCKKIWAIHTSPLFALKTALSVRNKEDIKLILTGVKSITGHLRDY